MDLREQQRITAEIERQKEVLEGHNETSKSYRDALREIKSLSADLVNLEKQIAKEKADYTGEAQRLNLGKQLEKLESGLLGSLQRNAGVTQTLNRLQQIRLQGDDELVDNAVKFTDLLAGANDGSVGLEEALRRIATEDFGALNEEAKEFLKVLLTSPNLKEEAGLDKQIIDTVDELTGGIYGAGKAILAASGIAGLLVAGLKMAAEFFIGFAKQTLEVRRNLGVSAVDALKLSVRMEKAALQTKLLGGDSEKAKELVTGLVTEFGNVNEASALSTKNIADLTTQLGIGGGETAKLLKVLSDVTGESLDSLSSTLEFEASLARAEGIPVAKVMADVAANADSFARAGKDGADEVFRAARAAADLGTNLSTVNGIMDSLVDVESSLTKQMEIEVLLQKDINLDRARQLAFRNDEAGVIEELQRIIGDVGIGDNRIVQTELASLFNVSVSDLAAFEAGGRQAETVTPPKAAEDSLTAVNNTNDILNKEHNKNQQRHEELLGALSDLNRTTKRAYA